MAVYTPLSEEEVSAFLARYDVGTLRGLKGIAEGVENSNFLITTYPPPERGRIKEGGGIEEISSDRPPPQPSPFQGEGEERYILTLYEKRVEASDLPFFLGMMEWLAGRGIPCPRPLHASDGSVICILKGKPAALVTFLEGQGCRSIRNAHLSLLGEMLARVHLAGEGFPLRRINTLSLNGWRALFATIRDKADTLQPGLSDLLGEELAYLERRWPRDLPRGVIHADLFPDNVFFVECGAETSLTGIIDFYFACDDFYVYDLAVCLNAWCFEANHEFNVTRAKLLLDAYHAARPISEAELEGIPILARGASLRFLLTRAHDWLFPAEGALVKPKDPMEYVKKLRFHRNVKHHGEYGL